MKFIDLKTRLKNGNWDITEIEIKTYVPIKVKVGILSQVAGNVIDNNNGYFTINRMETELSLYFLLCELYTDIDFEDKSFSDEDYDFFAENKFKEWLRKATKNDSFEFEQMFKNEVLDSVRKANATTQFDINGMESLLEQVKTIDPQILSFAEKLNTQKAAENLVELEMKK